MKKRQRILKNQEFQKIIKSKKFLRRNALVIYFLPKSEEQPRVGISVGKKVGNAVIRNKIKRQIRSITVSNYFKDNDQFDLVIMVMKTYFNFTFVEVEKDLIALLNKIRRLKNGK